MSLIKKNAKTPGPRAETPASGPTDYSRRLEDDFTGQLGPIFPDELQDAEATRSLQIAFLLGVRLGATRTTSIIDGRAAPLINAAAGKAASLISEKKSAGEPVPA